MAINFTESAINKAAREVRECGKQKDVYDAGCRGLMIRLTAGGVRTFNLSCRDLTGAARRFPLGSFPQMSIAEARNAARALHLQIKSGGPDPAKEKARLRAINADAKAGVGTLSSVIDIYERKVCSDLNRVHFENRVSTACNQKPHLFAAPQVRTARLRFPKWTRFKVMA